MSLVARPNAMPQPPKLPQWTFSKDQILSNFKKGWTPREQQVYAIGRIQEAFAAGKRIVAVEMPTGGGKTPLAVAVADTVRGMGGTYMLTSQKALQDQYARDYPAPHMELLKGRSNYACTHEEADPDMDAGHGVCHKMGRGILKDCIDPDVVDEIESEDPLDDGPRASAILKAVRLELKPCAHRCPYWEQLQKCNDSALTLLNFSSFLFQRRIGRFQKRALMIIDEAHGIEGQLMNYVTLELTEWALSVIDAKIDRDIASKAEFVEWLREWDIVRKIDQALENCDTSSEDKPDNFSKEEADALKELQGKLANFMSYLDATEWILETVSYTNRRREVARKIVARPLFVQSFANDLLFRHADRVIVLSATLLDVKVWAESLGISRDEFEHISTPCDFPPENRPVFLEYAGNLGRKHFSPEQNPTTPTKPKFVKKVQQILARHEGQRGVIHCHSFEFLKVLREEVNSPRFIYADQFDRDKQAMIAEHARRPDSVIVDPAVSEGFDFKDDLARFQIIAKVPWPSLGDKVIKERANRDERYYAWLTALKFVQTIGRVCRSKDDWGYTYVVDAGFEFFYSKNGDLIPGWCRQAFKKYAPTEVRRA